MRKTLTLLLLIAGCLCMAQTTKKTYELITDINALTSGSNYLIVAKSADKWYAMGGQKSSGRYAYEVSVTNNRIENCEIATTALDELPFEIRINKSSNKCRLADLLATNAYQYLIYDSGLKLGTNSTNYWTVTVSADGSTTLKGSSHHIAFSNVFGSISFNGDTDAPSNIYIFKEYISTVAAPTFSLVAGSSDSEKIVELMADDGLTVHYTLNGDDPTAEDEIYTEPISITETTTIKAIAVDNNGSTSNVVSTQYTITAPIAEEAPEEINLVNPTLWERIFYESFDKNSNTDTSWTPAWSSTILGDGGGIGVTSGTLPSENTDNAWTVKYTSAIAGNGCIIFRGRKFFGKAGKVTSTYSGELITPDNLATGTALLRFKAGAYNKADEQTSIMLRSNTTTARFVYDEKATDALTLPLTKGGFTHYEVLVTGLTAETRFRFCTPKENNTQDYNTRIFLDEIELYTTTSSTSTETVNLLTGSWSISDLLSAGLSPESNTEHDYTIIDKSGHTLTIDNTNGNPNLLIYTSESANTINAINVVEGNISATLTDLQPFASTKHESIEGRVSYQRIFDGVSDESGGWSVLCVPFDVTSVTINNSEYIPYTTWINEGGPTAKGFYWLKEISSMTDEINTDASQIAANTPYLIAFPNCNDGQYQLLNIAANTTVTFSGTAIRSTDNTAPAALQHWEFKPNYDNTTSEVYVLNEAGDAFVKQNTTQPFRPYLTYTAAPHNAPASFIIGRNNPPVPISTVLEDKPGIKRIYTAAGVLVRELSPDDDLQRLGLPQGVYIIDGHKVVITE